MEYLADMWSAREWQQVGDLLLAFVLSSLIGFERERKMKSAGLRTHALVGLGAALLILVSKHGFSDVLVDDHYRLDPSRVAAQIVSGIGFIGGGLIFVRKDIVHGLTTAATVWLTAAVGMACGAGLHLLAFATCGGYFLAVTGYTAMMNRVRGRTTCLRISYRTGQDAVARVMSACAERDFVIHGFSLVQADKDDGTATVELRLSGKSPVDALAGALASLEAVTMVDVNPPDE